MPTGTIPRFCLAATGRLKMLYFPKRGTFWEHGIGTGSLSLPYSAAICRVDPAGGSRKERDAVRGPSDGHRSQFTPFARPRSLCSGVFFHGHAHNATGSRHWESLHGAQIADQVADQVCDLDSIMECGFYRAYAIVRMRNCGLPAGHCRHCPGMDIFSKTETGYLTQ